MESLSIVKNPTITNQVKTLINKLCQIHSCTLPKEVEILVIPEYPKDSADDDSDDEYMVPDDEEEFLFENNEDKSEDSEKSDLDTVQKELLEKVSEQLQAKFKASTLLVFLLQLND